MPTTLVSGVSDAGTFNIQPAVGHAYCIRDFYSDIRLAGGVPDLSVAYADGTLTPAEVICDPFTAILKQYREFELYITEPLYLTVTETGAASIIGWSGHRVIPEDVRSMIFTVPDAAPSKFDVRPPAGSTEVWKVTEIGAETLTAATDFPDVTMTLESATLAGAIVARGGDNLVWNKGFEIYINRDFFLSFDSIAAADNDVALSIVRVPLEIFAGVIPIAQNATVAIQPPEGMEAVITTIGCSGWGGAGPPADGPNVTLSLTDGTDDATILSAASVIVDINANRRMNIEIDNTVYLNVTEPNVAPITAFAYSGYIRRQEHTT